MPTPPTEPEAEAAEAAPVELLLAGYPPPKEPPSDVEAFELGNELKAVEM